ncbi:DUF192 domain-containing protein [Polyangium aurulentum]|uniref:DUF192 domain-containing protein n=1 Tax=Polyangium aurulentum TaxID=2567896 RepID=UPI0010AEC9B0|nr:DUF192 domain-containing protein [Polyangium aurulentum]UQA58731.1 DUF192 domain-containing protein [Polyangium aurulentum]
MPARPLPSPPRARSPLAIALALTATLAACERRIEEPEPVARERVVDPSALGATGGKAPAPKRCIRATPDKPARLLSPDQKIPDPTCPKDPSGPFTMRTGTVSFPEAGDASVSVEVAEKEAERTRGLMYRRRMLDDMGMIFVFAERENHQFWMHNTCIPLDMLFIDDDGLIVGIQENVPTMDDSTFEVGCPSKYVLEVNAGWTRKHGVRAGQKVKLEGI